MKTAGTKKIDNNNTQSLDVSDVIKQIWVQSQYEELKNKLEWEGFDPLKIKKLTEWELNELFNNRKRNAVVAQSRYTLAYEWADGNSVFLEMYIPKTSIKNQIRFMSIYNDLNQYQSALGEGVNIDLALASYDNAVSKMVEYLRNNVEWDDAKDVNSRITKEVMEDLDGNLLMDVMLRIGWSSSDMTWEKSRETLKSIEALKKKINPS